MGQKISIQPTTPRCRYPASHWESRRVRTPRATGRQKLRAKRCLAGRRDGSLLFMVANGCPGSGGGAVWSIVKAVFRTSYTEQGNFSRDTPSQRWVSPKTCVYCRAPLRKAYFPERSRSSLQDASCNQRDERCVCNTTIRYTPYQGGSLLGDSCLAVSGSLAQCGLRERN